jgi:hypothetical protein
MKNFFGVLATVALIRATCLAATPTYVVTDDDNPSANSGTVYQLNSTTGALTQVAILKTGGTGLGFGFFATQGSSVAKNATCGFVLDNGSSDVAAFADKGGKISKVGNYSNSSLSLSGYAGGGAAIAPNGKTLYVTYSGSENIGVWSIASNCALTLAQTFVPSLGADLFGAISVDPSGKYVVFGSDSFEAADLATINATTGELTDAGNLSFTSLSGCSEGCYPTGIDFTKDSKVVLFGNANLDVPSVLSASLSSSGLSNAAIWSATNSANIVNVNIPFLSAAAYAGKGNLYLGASGFGSGAPAGVITATFTESPLNITITQAINITTSPDPYQDNIASAGNVVITSEVPSYLNTYKVASNGSLTLLKSTTDKQANGELNFVVYPNNR